MRPEGPFVPLPQHAGMAPVTLLQTIALQVELVVSHERNWPMSRVKPRITLLFPPVPPYEYAEVTSAMRQSMVELASCVCTAAAVLASAFWYVAIEQLSSTTKRKSTLPLPGAKTSHWYAFGSPNCASESFQ